MKELFRFVEGSTIWTYTSADQISIYDAGEGPEVYTPQTIGRDESEIRSELAKANLTVTLPVDNELAIKLIGSILENSVTLSIFETDDFTTNVVWKGRLASVKPDASSVKLVFESVLTSFRRYGLRMKYQRSCPHVLYGRGCNLDKADFAVSATVVSFSDNLVVVETADTWNPPYFIAGMLETASGLMRFIVGQGNPGGSIPNIHFTLTLFRPIPGMTNGDPITIYPGCDRSKETCDTVFDNLVNNGSFPFIPLINPFAGRSII